MAIKLKTLLFCQLFSVLAYADAWDTDYQQILNSIQEPEFLDTNYSIIDYGASTEATAIINQDAINKAIKLCNEAGGGRVIVPKGTYLTGAITLLSNVNLVVEDGATLLFAFQPELYPVVLTRWEGLDCWNISPCIYAYKQSNVAITGKGIIDGGGTNETWWKWCGKDTYGWKEGEISQSNGARPQLLKMAEDGVDVDQRRFGPKDGLRPQLINFNQCDKVLIENVTLLRSPFWVIHPLLSKNIIVRDVNISNDGPNGDGCDPESCDGVLIENCFFNTGDDCIAIKSGRNNDGRLWNKPSENIIIRNCEMRNGHGGVVIGSEISGGCRNVFAENNVMDSPNLERVVRIKTNTCRGGIIENIYVRNIDVGQCSESVLKINLDYEPNEICCRGFLPTVRNVYLNNVTCRKSKYGVQIIALDTCVNVYNINVSNCNFEGVAQGNSIKGLTRDIRFDNLRINNGLSLLEKPFKNYSQWMTSSEIKRTPLPYMLDFSKKPKWSYVMGIELEAMLDTYLKYGGEEIKDYCLLYTDTMINEKGEIKGYNIKDYNLDQIRTGHFVARMYSLFPEKKNFKALKTLAKQMQNQPRTDEGVYWHKAIYAYQVWLDGIYMGLPFSALTAPMLFKGKKITSIYDDAVDQITKTYERTLDPKTKLNRHAWDETRQMFWADKTTGLSQHCWGRAQGWYTMALIELLDALPRDYPRRQEVIELLKKDLEAVVKWQDKKSGVWYQVMDSPTREGNYLEATCSSMFAYALLKAYRKGYVSEKYRDAGIKAYRGIINNFIRIEADTTISLTSCCAVAGLGPGVGEKVNEAAKKYGINLKENTRRDGSFQYYLSEQIRDNDAKGIGPFIWASLEMEEMGYDTQNIDQPIDRKAVVTRHNPINIDANPLNSLTVGNGHIASTVDITGLQSFPFDYEAGVPLNTMTDWAWHSFENTNAFTPQETWKSLDLGHQKGEIYAVEYKEEGRSKDATAYYRANPHRLNMGTIGLEMINNDGKKADINDIENAKQTLELWYGTIESNFTVFQKNVDVTTFCLPKKDALVARVKTELLKQEQAKVVLNFPYPTGGHADNASDWSKGDKHFSEIIQNKGRSATIKRTIDTTTYYVSVKWEGDAKLIQEGKHTFSLATTDDVLTFCVEFKQESTEDNSVFRFDQAIKEVKRYWPAYWEKGAMVDFAQCTDTRAMELERRVVLSQYLTAVNCANFMPPQETGLTYNSWYGRPHLEMTWWHAVHFALWGRSEVVAKMLEWYDNVAFPKAKEIASRQGYDGVRWMKMTDPMAGEAPSNTGSFLIWQQPHYIYLAEEIYRNNPSDSILEKYAYQVEQTAEFMASYALSCKSQKDGKIKMYGYTAMQETMSKDFSYNHPFEQAYWIYGLNKAQEWRQRMGKPRLEKWDNVIKNMALPAENNGIYVAGEPLNEFEGHTKGQEFDPFISAEMQGNSKISAEDFDLKSRSDHPAILGAYGLLPHFDRWDETKMNATYDWVDANWNWNTTWGWDYGMTAMCLARLKRAGDAVNALLVDRPKNTYLFNGHNFQEEKRLRIYLPGNGALLDAVAMMCAGWEGCETLNNPGFPHDGTWDVRWEGLHRMQ